jgi:hypothetical protein
MLAIISQIIVYSQKFYHQLWRMVVELPLESKLQELEQMEVLTGEVFLT